MTRKANEIWYGAMRKLGGDPATRRLTPAEAREEFLRSPSTQPSQPAQPLKPPTAQYFPDNNHAKEHQDMELTCTPQMTLLGQNGLSLPGTGASRETVARRLDRKTLAVAAAVLGVALGSAFFLQQFKSGGDPNSRAALVPLIPGVAGESGEHKEDKQGSGSDQGKTSPGQTDEGTPSDNAASGYPSEYSSEHSTKSREVSPGEEFFASVGHTQGQHVRVYSSMNDAFRDRMLATSEGAYSQALRFFGRPLSLADDQRLQVVVADTTDQYNMLSQNLGGDEKSSAFYAFSSIWLDRNAGGYGEQAGGYGKEAGTEEIQAEATRWIGLVGVTQFAKAESLTAIYLSHATVEQYIRLLIGPEALETPPRWFIDGVACYIGRWQKPNLFGWSRQRLIAVGGPSKLKRLTSGYQPDEKHILTSGMVVSFLKSDQCPKKMQQLFQQSLASMSEGQKVAKTFRKLEKSLIKNEKLVRKFADL